MLVVEKTERNVIYCLKSYNAVKFTQQHIKSVNLICVVNTENIEMLFLHILALLVRLEESAKLVVPV